MWRAGMPGTSRYAWRGHGQDTAAEGMGAVVDARVGIGSVNAGGLKKRDDKYYNAAYAQGKLVVRVEGRGWRDFVERRVARTVCAYRL
jgi:hypothetical protein